MVLSRVSIGLQYSYEDRDTHCIGLKLKLLIKIEIVVTAMLNFTKICYLCPCSLNASAVCAVMGVRTLG